jgi:hypothetical protein
MVSRVHPVMARAFSTLGQQIVPQLARDGMLQDATNVLSNIPEAVLHCPAFQDSLTGN